MAYRHNNNYRLNERLNHVETQVSSIDAKVESMQSDVYRLVQAFDNFISTAGKTNWGTLAAWVAVAITAVGALVYHNSMSLEPVRITNEYQHRDIAILTEKIEKLEVDYARLNPSL